MYMALMEEYRPFTYRKCYDTLIQQYKDEHFTINGSYPTDEQTQKFSDNIIIGRGEVKRIVNEYEKQQIDRVSVEFDKFKKHFTVRSGLKLLSFFGDVSMFQLFLVLGIYELMELDIVQSSEAIKNWLISIPNMIVCILGFFIMLLRIVIPVCVKLSKDEE